MPLGPDGNATVALEGTTFVRSEGGYDVYQVDGGGEYSFVSEPPPPIDDF